MSDESKPDAQQEMGPDGVKFFELTRAQIQHEDSLINNRLTWLLALQAFLFSAYGFSLGAESTIRVKDNWDSVKYLRQQVSLIQNARLAFALMSFMAAIVLLCGIAAAAVSMEKLKDDWKSHKDFSAGKYPQVIGERLPYLGMYGGLLPTYFLPIATSITWIWLEYREPIAWFFFLLVLLCATLGITCLSRQHTLCSKIFRWIHRQTAARLYAFQRKFR